MSLNEVCLFLFYRILAIPFKCIPIDQKLIVLEAYYGKGFEDSPSEIAKELYARFQDKIQLIWLIKDGEDVSTLPPYIKPVKRFSIKELYYLSRAKVWIDNCRKTRGVNKRKGQYYIQTWHGGIGSKRVEKQVINTLSKGYVKNAIHDSKMADLFLAGSRWQTKLYRNAFWYDGEILECGLPRNDIFFREPSFIQNKVRTFYNIESNKRIAVYAPTFRDRKDPLCYNLDCDKLLKILSEQWGGEWVIIVRMHPSAVELQSRFHYSKSVLNGTVYPEMNELTMVSELFISDYSSSIFDAILTPRRVIRYATDIEKYNEYRGTNIPEEELPFPTAKNNSEMEQLIENYQFTYEIERQKDFLEKMGSYERGTASKCVVNKLINVLNIKK